MHDTWAWPTKEQRKLWQYDTTYEEIGIDYFRNIMTHLWRCTETKKKRNETDMQNPATRRNRDGVLVFLAKLITNLFITEQLPIAEFPLHGRNGITAQARIYSFGRDSQNSHSSSFISWMASTLYSNRTNSNSDDQNPAADPTPSSLWQDISIEIETTSADTIVFDAVPKKIKEKLTWHTKIPPIGWGLCVEERFAVPWQVTVLVSLLAIAGIAFGIIWSTSHDFDGFSVAGVTIAVSTLIYTLWTVMAKSQSSL